MEAIIYRRVSPLLKCVVLFLFIFTAKVLTTRPQETQDGRNSIHHLKAPHFVRTFTKYHHRRTIQYNQDYWPTDENSKFKSSESNWDEQSKRVKRNAVRNSNEFISSTNSKYSEPETFRDNEKKAISNTGDGIKNSGTLDKNSLSNEVKKYKVKQAFFPTSTSTKRPGPLITCLYKLNSISLSATRTSYDDKPNEAVVDNEIFEIGPVSKQTLPNGETVEVEECTDNRAYCYTLWHQDISGNVTVLGQGCWHNLGPSMREGCTKTPQLPETSRFCRCATSYCNQHYMFLADDVVLLPPEPQDSSTSRAGYSGAVLSAVLCLLAVLAAGVAVHTLYCRRRRHARLEKVDVMLGSGSDGLGKGLSCVDNLSLVEHIGQGKFGSVWRGTLGGAPVAVKVYSSPAAWQKEAAVYALPHLHHPNILRYYGSDTRPALDGCSTHLLVVELCEGTLRARLHRAPLTWLQYARLAHGVASALAHLHTHNGSKPCVVHRDVNSNNVLVVNETARLADLGLAQLLPTRAQPAQPSRITEAGTLRYLSPEALEGALDLSSPAGALCAVDVFALGLVLWEMVWRCAGAHPGGTPPPYRPPYGDQLPARPTLQQMQSLVSRNKARPPLPRGDGAGGVSERALRIANDTCDECWDHDAEARLTAVCVEERMLELLQLLQPPASAPAPRTDNLHTHTHHAETHHEQKNTNQTCDVTPAPHYPPHVGRNACIQRNTHVHAPTPTHLVHKSLKDTPDDTHSVNITNTPVQEQCLSVARDTRRPVQEYENSERFNEIRSYQRPIEFVANDVSIQERQGPKETNLMHEKEKPKWSIKKFLEKRLGRKLETEVKLVPENSLLIQNGKTKTSLVGRCDRPSNLVLDQERNYNFEIPCTLSPPNRTLSPTMLMESHMHRENRAFGFKEIPSADENKSQNQVFAVIVPKAKPTDYTNLIELQNKRGSSDSVKNSVRTSMSSQSFIKSGNSESEDSTVKKRLSCDNRIINSGRSSRASINLELQYMDRDESPFDLNSDCSSSEDEHLMLLSENGGSKITMQTIPKQEEKKKNEVLKESSQKTEIGFNFQNRYKNFDNEFSDPNDKENLIGYSGDNPVYIAALNGEINTDLKILDVESPKKLAIKRQHSLEQVREIFSSSGSVNLQNPANRVLTPGDIPAAVRAVRRARRGAAHRARDSNRLSLYDDRMMFGNSL